MRRALLYAAALLCPLLLTAQGADTTDLPKGKVIPMSGAFLQPLQERDSVLIADQLLYGFELKQLEEGTQIALPQWQNDEKGGVMAIGSWTLDTLKVRKQKKGQPRLLDIRGSLRITSFDEGLYELPSIKVGRLNEEGVIDTLVFDPMRLEVKTMPVDTATFVPHDIKGQIRYPVTFREVLPWLGGGVAAAGLIALAVYLIVRYARKKREEEEKKDPAHIVALRKLDRYRGAKMWAPEHQKEFYSGVTDTLREYMDARYGISAMEMTTAEIFSGMKSEDVDKELMDKLKDLFERADFVKFAKYVASDEDNATVLPLAVRFVTETYQADVEAGEEIVNEGEIKEGGKE